MLTGHKHQWMPIKVKKTDRLRCMGCQIVIDGTESMSEERRSELAREARRKLGLSA